MSKLYIWTNTSIMFNWTSIIIVIVIIIAINISIIIVGFI